MVRTFDELEPTELENLTYDTLQLAGVKSLVWRTPGADGGRDIEGIVPIVDFSGEFQLQKWYIECKRYRESVDWPTVWKKIAHADVQQADYLLLVTNSNPSPSCESLIADWNTTRRPTKVRVWRGYDLERILRSYPAVLVKYGLAEPQGGVSSSFEPIITQLMRSAQAAASAYGLGFDPTTSLDFVAALSEFVSEKSEQLRRYGRTSKVADRSPSYAWLSWTGDPATWDASGLRALITAVHHAAGGGKVAATATPRELRLVVEGGRISLVDRLADMISEIVVLADVELKLVSDSEVMFLSRGE